MSEEFDFERIKNKAIEQLKAGKPLLGKDGAFAPLLESILNGGVRCSRPRAPSRRSPGTPRAPRPTPSRPTRRPRSP